MPSNTDPAAPPARLQAPADGGRGLLASLARLALVLGLLFLFLVSIELMSKAIQGLSTAGMGSKEELFTGVSNPFAGLAIGVLFTVMVQSSSTTTATIVAVVGSGTLSVEHAVPMIMGANIGTTVTNTLVSLGSVRRSAEFRRAFAAATVHDFFNLMCVAALLPLELATGFLSHSAAWLSSRIPFAGGKFDSPVKQGIKAAAKFVRGLLELLGLEGTWLHALSLVVGLALTFLCLYMITRHMRTLLAGTIERAVNRLLEGSALLGMAVGVALTVAVQSSSITTSLLVPLCAAGVMTLRSVFPVTLGANVGTTVTALLASLATDRVGALTIALVHLLFNLTGTALVYPFKPIREIPLRAAEGLARLATVNRMWILVYIGGMFVLLPALGWILWSD